VIRPPALRRGDTIGVVAPSSPTAARVPRRLARGVAELERRGFRVRVGEHVRDVQATKDEKVADLHAAFADDEVHAIVCTIGGYDSHQLLDRIDFDLVAAHPKVFCGYSDITSLNAALHERAGLVTFMGPMLLPDWAEFGGVPAYTWAEWEATVMRAEPRGPIGTAPEWTAEMTRWDEADDRPRVGVDNPGPRTVRGGTAAGPLVPVNLSTLLLLAATPWWPSLDGALLALEIAEEEGAWWAQRSLHQLRQIGVYERAAGIAFGRVNPASELPADELDRILLEATEGSSFPIVVDLDFGHTEPKCTLPWGVRAELDGDAASLALVEAAVA
jgi:muramoyltetrapeptide carboxypeptidase